jgi:16S rRNA (cytidine1402-2'-O)-methyltransferase
MRHSQILTMGVLYLVATPIGNLEDITLRALRVLKEADLIACEDTRHTAKLLAHYGIATPRQSYHQFNEESRAQQLIRLLHEGKNIALVSDSGTPLISDPGYEIVSNCRREGIPVIPIPGPSAAVSALIASGLPSEPFFFEGFLPSKSSLRKRRLEKLAVLPATLILYESPHRLMASLDDMVALLGARRATLARELTKVHEEFLHGSLSEILNQLRMRERILGEITIVIERGENAPPPVDYPAALREHLKEELRKTGLPRNEALKSVAKQRGITRKQAYEQLNDELREMDDE